MSYIGHLFISPTYLPKVLMVKPLKAYLLFVTINLNGPQVRWSPSHLFTLNLAPEVIPVPRPVFLGLMGEGKGGEHVTVT